MIPGDAKVSGNVISAALEVHGLIGSPLLESTYEECLALELTLRGIPFLLDGLVVEVKAVERILVVHEAQLLTYMRMLGVHTGLLLNFRVARMKDGIRRLTL